LPVVSHLYRPSLCADSGQPPDPNYVFVVSHLKALNLNVVFTAEYLEISDQTLRILDMPALNTTLFDRHLEDKKKITRRKQAENL
jgi:hypothetical protein